MFMLIMKMRLNLSATGQRVFVPVFGPREQGSGLRAHPHHGQTRPRYPREKKNPGQ